MAGWHHRLDGRESEWTPGVGDGQEGLACCDSGGRKELDTTEWLNWTELIHHCDSVLYTHKHTHTQIYNWIYREYIYSFQIIFPYRLLQNIEYSSLCYRVGSCWLSISHMVMLLLSHFSRVQLCATPWTAAYQASPSMGFSRQEHWSGLPLPSPRHESGKWKWSRSVGSNS